MWTLFVAVWDQQALRFDAYHAGTAEVVPVKDCGKYVGLVVATVLPFCPSILYAQLI